MSSGKQPQVLGIARLPISSGSLRRPAQSGPLQLPVLAPDTGKHIGAIAVAAVVRWGEQRKWLRVGTDEGNASRGLAQADAADAAPSSRLPRSTAAVLPARAPGSPDADQAMPVPMLSQALAADAVEPEQAASDCQSVRSAGSSSHHSSPIRPTLEQAPTELPAPALTEPATPQPAQRAPLAAARTASKPATPAHATLLDSPAARPAATTPVPSAPAPQATPEPAQQQTAPTAGLAAAVASLAVAAHQAMALHQHTKAELSRFKQYTQQAFEPSVLADVGALVPQGGMDSSHSAPPALAADLLAHARLDVSADAPADAQADTSHSEDPVLAGVAQAADPVWRALAAALGEQAAIDLELHDQELREERALPSYLDILHGEPTTVPAHSSSNSGSARDDTAWLDALLQEAEADAQIQQRTQALGSALLQWPAALSIAEGMRARLAQVTSCACEIAGVVVQPRMAALVAFMTASISAGTAASDAPSAAAAALLPKSTTDVLASLATVAVAYDGSPADKRGGTEHRPAALKDSVSGKSAGRSSTPVDGPGDAASERGSTSFTRASLASGPQSSKRGLKSRVLQAVQKPWALPSYAARALAEWANGAVSSSPLVGTKHPGVRGVGAAQWTLEWELPPVHTSEEPDAPVVQHRSTLHSGYTSDARLAAAAYKHSLRDLARAHGDDDTAAVEHIAAWTGALVPDGTQVIPLPMAARANAVRQDNGSASLDYSGPVAIPVTQAACGQNPSAADVVTLPAYFVQPDAVMDWAGRPGNAATAAAVQLKLFLHVQGSKPAARRAGRAAASRDQQHADQAAAVPAKLLVAVGALPLQPLLTSPGLRTAAAVDLVPVPAVQQVLGPHCAARVGQVLVQLALCVDPSRPIPAPLVNPGEFRQAAESTEPAALDAPHGDPPPRPTHITGKPGQRVGGLHRCADPLADDPAPIFARAKALLRGPKSSGNGPAGAPAGAAAHGGSLATGQSQGSALLVMSAVDGAGRHSRLAQQLPGTPQLSAAVVASYAAAETRMRAARWLAVMTMPRGSPAPVPLQPKAVPVGPAPILRQAPSAGAGCAASLSMVGPVYGGALSKVPALAMTHDGLSGQWHVDPRVQALCASRARAVRVVVGQLAAISHRAASLLLCSGVHAWSWWRGVAGCSPACVRGAIDHSLSIVVSVQAEQQCVHVASLVAPLVRRAHVVHARELPRAQVYDPEVARTAALRAAEQAEAASKAAAASRQRSAMRHTRASRLRAEAIQLGRDGESVDEQSGRGAAADAAALVPVLVRERRGFAARGVWLPSSAHELLLPATVLEAAVERLQHVCTGPIALRDACLCVQASVAARLVLQQQPGDSLSVCPPVTLGDSSTQVPLSAALAAAESDPVEHQLDLQLAAPVQPTRDGKEDPVNAQGTVFPWEAEAYAAAQDEAPAHEQVAWASHGSGKLAVSVSNAELGSCCVAAAWECAARVVQAAWRHCQMRQWAQQTQRGVHILEAPSDVAPASLPLSTPVQQRHSPAGTSRTVSAARALPPRSAPISRVQPRSATPSPGAGEQQCSPAMHDGGSSGSPNLRPLPAQGVSPHMVRSTEVAPQRAELCTPPRSATAPAASPGEDQQHEAVDAPQLLPGPQISRPVALRSLPSVSEQQHDAQGRAELQRVAAVLAASRQQAESLAAAAAAVEQAQAAGSVEPAWQHSLELYIAACDAPGVRRLEYTFPPVSLRAPEPKRSPQRAANPWHHSTSDELSIQGKRLVLEERGGSVGAPSEGRLVQRKPARARRAARNSTATSTAPSTPMPHIVNLVTSAPTALFTSAVECSPDNDTPHALAVHTLQLQPADAWDYEQVRTGLLRSCSVRATVPVPGTGEAGQEARRLIQALNCGADDERGILLRAPSMLGVYAACLPMAFVSKLIAAAWAEPAVLGPQSSSGQQAAQSLAQEYELPLWEYNTSTERSVKMGTIKLVVAYRACQTRTGSL